MRKAIISVFTSIFLLSGCSTFKPHQISVEPLNPTVTTSSTLPADLQIEIHSKDMPRPDLNGYRISSYSYPPDINPPLPHYDAQTQRARDSAANVGAAPTKTTANRLTT